MPDISAYSQPYGGQNQDANYNFDLISKVMQNKQSEFDASLRNLQNLKSQSLNIRFINEDRQKQVDGYNKQLSDKFSNLNGEYGDLSDAKNYNNYLSWFDNIAKDTDLINAYHVDKQWQNQVYQKDSMKMAKDPQKAGYAPLNEQVFNSHLNKYAKSTKDNPVDFQPYMPFHDQIKDMSNIAKSIPKQEWTNEKVLDNGYVYVEQMKGVSAEQLRMAMEGSGFNRSQSDVEAEYLFLRNNKLNPAAFRDSVRGQYETREKQLKIDYQGKMNDTEVQLAREKDADKISLLQQYKQTLQGKLDGIDKEVITPDGWQQMKDSDLLSRYSDLHFNNQINSISSGMASKVSHSYRRDDTFLAHANLVEKADIATKNLALRAAELNETDKYHKARLELQRMQIEGTTQSKIGLDVNGNLLSPFGTPNLQPMLDQQGAISTNVKKDEYKSISDVQNQNSAKAFNLFDDSEFKTRKGADGKDYSPTIPWQGKSLSNNDMIKQFANASTDMASWNQFSSVVSKDQLLPNNASVQVLNGIMPKLVNDPTYQKLSDVQKVLYLKREVTDLINLTPEAATRYGQEGVTLSNMYNSTKQFEKVYNNKLGIAVNQTIKDLGGGNSSWEQFTAQHPDDKVAAQQRIANLMMNSPGTAMLLGRQRYNFEDIPIKKNLSEKISPHIEAQMNFRKQISNVLKQQYNLKDDVSLDLIHSATNNGDGTMSIYFDPDADKYKGVSSEITNLATGTYEGPSILGQHIMGLRKLSTIKIKIDAAIEKPNEIDKIVTAGGVSTTSIYRNGKLFKIDLYQAGNERTFGYNINGVPQPTYANSGNLYPREVLKAILESQIK